MTDKYVLVIRKDFKGKLLSKRKDFMDLLLKALGDNDEAAVELADRFGTKLATKYNTGNSVTILIDGDVGYKD